MTFNREYELSDLVSFVGNKIEADKVTLKNYISTDNMLSDRGGVESATKLPSAPRFNNFKENDTLFSNIRTYFKKVWLADFEGGASPDVLIFRSNTPDILDPVFLHFLLSNEDFINYTVLTAKGVKMPRGDKSAIMQYKFFLPEIDKQKKIGCCLSVINKKIALNTKTNETLEKLAQALFKSWFVDFDPVKAKEKLKEERGGDLDSIAKELGMSKEILALFPDEFEESELGLIPKGWEVKPFGKLIKKTIGGDWGKEAPDQKHTEEVKILRGTDLPKVYRMNDSSVPIRYVEEKKLKTRIIEEGDIVIEISGGTKNQPTGRSLYFTQDLIDRLGYKLEPASFCRLFKPATRELGLYLGFHLMKIYDDGKTWLYQNQSTGISNFQTTIFLEKEVIVVPEEKVFDVFYSMVEPMFLKMHSSGNKNLVQLRDTLLPKLLSGEITIKEAEINIDE